MIAVGVDTHKERHFAVALDGLGQLLGELVIEACAAGYEELLCWAAAVAADGQRLAFAIEGAGSWGAGLCEHLQGAGCSVVEVERLCRRDRRRGKSDRIEDALAAAKHVLTGEGTSTPRQRGVLSALRALLIAQHSAVTERTRLLNQIHSLHATAPVALRERIGRGSGKQLERRLATTRARKDADTERTVLAVMRDLAGRSRALAADAARYQRELAQLVGSVAPTLLDEVGIGPISAAKLLVCDPGRFKNEAAFARCNGTAPLPASSGKTVRHHLSRGGDRQVNNAIHTIALSRSLHHPETRTYLDRRISEGKTKREAMRALKRHLSRSLFNRLIEVPLTS